MPIENFKIFMNKLLHTQEYFEYNLHEVILGTEFEEENILFLKHQQILQDNMVINLMISGLRRIPVKMDKLPMVTMDGQK